MKLCPTKRTLKTQTKGKDKVNSQLKSYCKSSNKVEISLDSQWSTKKLKSVRNKSLANLERKDQRSHERKHGSISKNEKSQPNL